MSVVSWLPPHTYSSPPSEALLGHDVGSTYTHNCIVRTRYRHRTCIIYDISDAVKANKVIYVVICKFSLTMSWQPVDTVHRSC